MTQPKNSIELFNIEESEDNEVKLSINNINSSESESISTEFCDFDSSDINKQSIINDPQKILDNVKLINLEKYGVDINSQSKKNENVEKYNVDCILQSKIDIIGAGC